MECMKDTVGAFQGCNAPIPLFNMWLSQLPGIEFSNIDQIANADQVDWQGVWNDVQNTAVDTFREDIIEEFGKRYLLNQIMQTVDLGKGIDETNTTLPIANTYNGILAETMEQFNQCTCSNLQLMYIQSVNFFWQGTNIAPDFTLVFKNADTLEVEKQIIVSTATPGWNNILVDTNFNAKRLYVYASGNFDTYVEQDISQFFLNNFGGWNGGWSASNNYLWFSYGNYGCQSRIRGLVYNELTNTASTGTNTFGLSIIFSTKCSWDTVVCNNKKHFASAWQHRLAIELINYRRNTSRINRWMTIDARQADKLQRLFNIKLFGGTDPDTGTKYPGKLQSSVTSLVLDPNDGCIKCNDYLIWREARL